MGSEHVVIEKAFKESSLFISVGSDTLLKAVWIEQDFFWNLLRENSPVRELYPLDTVQVVIVGAMTFWAH